MPRHNSSKHSSSSKQQASKRFRHGFDNYCPTCGADPKHNGHAPACQPFTAETFTSGLFTDLTRPSTSTKG